MLAFSGCEPETITPEDEKTEQPDQTPGTGEEGDKEPGDGTEGGGTEGDGNEGDGNEDDIPTYNDGNVPTAGYPAGAFTTADVDHDGIRYMWDESFIPEITIHINADEWNKLLKRYDEFSHNVDISTPTSPTREEMRKSS